MTEVSSLQMIAMKLESDEQSEFFDSLQHNDDENRPLGRKKKNRSSVWSFFQRVPEHESSSAKAVCLTCGQELPYTEGNANGLRTHLRALHPNLSKVVDGPKFVKDDNKVLRDAILHNWNSKIFSDVEVHCGLDSGVVQTHRLILAALSPYLRIVLTSEDFCSHNESALFVPDIASDVLSSFIASVCRGRSDIAVVDPSLLYLGFNDPIDVTKVYSIKSEPISFLDTMEVGHISDGYSGDGYSSLHERDEDLTARPKGNNSDCRKRKKRSLTWKYFDRIDGTLASCKTCKTVVKTEKGNTSGMSGHLRTSHPDLFTALKLSRQSNESFGDELSEKKPACYLIDGLDAAVDEFIRPLKRKKRSLVWNYFVQKDSNNAACKNCDATIKTEMGNTTGMANHLRGTHPNLYKELQESRGEKSHPIIEERHENDVDDIDDARINEDDMNDESMSELMIEMSPVWHFFEPDVDPDKIRCLECDKVLNKPIGTTSTLIRHLKREHEDLFDSTIKLKLENPDLPEPSDDLHPIWQFFDNNFQIEGQENISSVRCKDCLCLFPIHDLDFDKLQQHLQVEHPPSHESYENICSEWRQHRLHEAGVAQRLDDEDVNDSGRRKTGPRTTRSAVWNYFQRTDDKTKNLCLACGKTLVCNQQNTTNMIRHLECNHHEQFVQFLKDSGSSDQNIIGAAEDRSRKRRGPKPTYSDDPVNRTCPDCQKVYSCRPAMLYHRKTVHSGLRPYKCNVCEMTFARPDSFRGHTHSKVRSYLCSHCGKTFARKNIRDQHERAHRGDKRYNCGFCSKLFMTNQQRANHERTHTGEKPYQCTECGRQFAQQHQLTTHMRIHTGEKPYNCQHCGQKFRHLSSRNNHKCEIRVGVTAIRWTEHQQQDHDQHPILGNE